MKSFKYRFLLWQFIAALDTGKYDSLDIDLVKRHANAGTIGAFIVDRFGNDLDLSIFDAKDWAEIGEAWANIANAVDASRKFGVENKGISLLLAYTFQSMQALDREKEAA